VGGGAGGGGRKGVVGGAEGRREGLAHRPSPITGRSPVAPSVDRKREEAVHQAGFCPIMGTSFQWTVPVTCLGQPCNSLSESLLQSIESLFPW